MKAEMEKTALEMAQVYSDTVATRWKVSISMAAALILLRNLSNE